jgi:hypothetical protein
VSLNAVQQYLRGQLDGLESRTLPVAQAWVLPPPITQPADNPQIYIWGGTLDEDRYTLPRFQGQKRVAHTVSMWIQWVSSNDADLVQQFPVFLDTIRGFLRSLPIPAALTDPTTGEASVLLNVGERILQEYGIPLALADQRMLLNSAALRVVAAEILNPA